MLPTLIDSIIILLLIGTLVYAYILDRRVRTLMAVLRELGPTVGAFSSAVDLSARSVEDLRDLSLSARRPGPDLQSAGERTPAGEEDTPSEPRSALQKRAEQLRSRNPVRGQAPVRGKSELVRTFFDISKEREK
tara:strand:+ start:277 stop:678 length:402 start_codon:yes stop_codon:yes gene_type:complete